MSAAATAAGYLYASGRLRGRSAREQEQSEKRSEEKQPAAPPREPIRAAVLPQQEDKPRRTPKIEYRRRRWSAA